jgi:hypothetical protein
MENEIPNLLKTINKEINDFKGKTIQVVPGLPFNQYDLIQQIFFYYNSKFTTGDTDEDGDKKYFYNIVKNPCKVFSKAIDFDTKNIRLLTSGGGDPNKTWFMERDLDYWMRDKQFGKVLNRIFKELPIFGSVVLKVVDGYPYFVDLRNFAIDSSAEDVDCANYITEIHNFTPIQFRKAAKQMGWSKEKVDETLEKFHAMKDMSHIRIYERYGEVAKLKENGIWEFPYERIFLADVGVDEYDQAGNLTLENTGVLLAEDVWEDNPYWEFHAEKMAGRWLGIGVVETLIEPQIRLNELSNLQAKASYWSALRVFQTRDSAISRNLLTDVRNGEIMNVDSEITQIDMSDRNLAYFNEEHQKWLANRDEQTFSYDVVQGERLPAGTPLGAAQIATTQTLSYFEQIQENVAMDVKELLYKVIIPTFEKENKVEHTLRLVGKDLDKYIDMVKNDLALKEFIRMVATNPGHFPTNSDRDALLMTIEQAIKQGKEKILTVPKGFYKDVKYDVDIDITGESVDTRVRYATKFAILQAITADPSVTTDPIKRQLLLSMAEDGGLNTTDLLGDAPKESAMQPQMPGRAGGGVSAPDLSKAIPGQMSQTL